MPTQVTTGMMGVVVSETPESIEDMIEQALANDIAFVQLTKIDQSTGQELPDPVRIRPVAVTMIDVVAAQSGPGGGIEPPPPGELPPPGPLPDPPPPAV